MGAIHVIFLLENALWEKFLLDLLQPHQVTLGHCALDDSWYTYMGLVAMVHAFILNIALQELSHVVTHWYLSRLEYMVALLVKVVTNFGLLLHQRLSWLDVLDLWEILIVADDSVLGVCEASLLLRDLSLQP